MAANRVAKAADTLTFHRVEQPLGRGGILVLGVGILGPVNSAKNVGFGFIVVASLMNLVALIARRVQRKDVAT